MNSVQNVIFGLKGKLIELEKCIISTGSFHDNKVKEANARISEIKNLALSLPKYYQVENRLTDSWIRKTFFLAIKAIFQIQC